MLEPSVVESADLRKVPKGQGVLKEAKDLAAKEDKVLIGDFRKSDLDDLLRLLPECFAEEFEVSGFDPDHTRDMGSTVRMEERAGSFFGCCGSAEKNR